MMDMFEMFLKYFVLDIGLFGDCIILIDDYWVDMCDELFYGDQFQNVVFFNVMLVDVGIENMFFFYWSNGYLG